MDDADLGQALAGRSFRVFIPRDAPLKNIRRDARNEWGLDIHIRLKAYFLVLDPEQTSMGAYVQVEVVDDTAILEDYLDVLGEINFPPHLAMYVGHFKEPAFGEFG